MHQETVPTGASSSQVVTKQGVVKQGLAKPAANSMAAKAVMVVTFILATFLPSIITAPAANAAGPQLTSFDQELISLVNSKRVEAGLPAVQEATGLTQLSVWWSSQLADGATGYNLEHNPNAFQQVLTYGASNRTTWGENVAKWSPVSVSAQTIFNAYWASPGHKANILGQNFRYVGMGSVTGSNGISWNTMTFTDKVDPGQVVGTPPPAPVGFTDGEFVQAPDNVTYRIIGNAPIPVTAWSRVGGVQPVRMVTAAQFATLSQYPVDGSLFTADGVVYVLEGGAPLAATSWGAIGGVKPAPVVDSAAVANAGAGGQWNHLRQLPADGSFVQSSSGVTYVIAGGSPLPVTSWANVGGVKPVTLVDEAAISNAGAGGQWNHLNRTVANGSFVQGSSGTTYVIAGGAPLPVTSWANVGGVKPVTMVDEAAITNAGGGGQWNHLNRVPVDGTFVQGSSGTTYSIVGGAPLPVLTWAAVGGVKSVTLVDEAAITNAGGGAPWNHLNGQVANGTFLLGSSGVVYRVAGGAPLAVNSWANVGGVQNYTAVDENAITRAGSGAPWNRLSQVPADGTFLTVSDGKVYRVQAGVASYVSSWAPYGGAQPTTLIDYLAIERAGTGGVWNHLNAAP